MSDREIPERPDLHDADELRQALEEAHKEIRVLLRQLSKEQARHHEAARAHSKTIANLLEMTRENTALAQERDQWKARAEGASPVINERMPLPILTAEEARAIRKAITRLHRSGDSDADRLRLWESLLASFDRT